MVVSFEVGHEGIELVIANPPTFRDLLGIERNFVHSRHDLGCHYMVHLALRECFVVLRLVEDDGLMIKVFLTDVYAQLLHRAPLRCSPDACLVYCKVFALEGLQGMAAAAVGPIQRKDRFGVRSSL